MSYNFLSPQYGHIYTNISLPIETTNKYNVLTPAWLRAWAKRGGGQGVCRFVVCAEGDRSYRPMYTRCVSHKGNINWWLHKLDEADTDHQCGCGEVMTEIHVVEACPE